MGTPGHMAHPFDVEVIQTGDDLLEYINDAITKLSAGEIYGSVKWDGINTSFKLVTDENGKKDFRMDRGTSHIDSVIGLTAADAYKKWPKGHGMPPAIEKLLSIFNKALPTIEPELKTLGMWDDPTKYFNTEYIEGTSNVQDYDANILAIHGINQFYEKKAQPHAIRKGTSMDRPGAPRPMDTNGKPTKAGGIEIQFDHRALEHLIRKVQPYAADYNFQIFGDVPVSFDPEMELDIEAVLETPISIQIEEGNIKTASLREWLKTVTHPKDKKITKIIRDKNGTPTGTKEVGALSKDIYMAVLRSATDGGMPLNEYLKEARDISSAIDGGIFYHATRLLGQAIKNVLTSEAGNLEKHEGVVLRGLEDFLVKLTGDFIVQGLASTHGDHVSESLEQDFTVTISKGRSVTKTLTEWIVEAKKSQFKYTVPPKLVYQDIIAGAPVTEIVNQDIAQETIYNTIITYVKNLKEVEDGELPPWDSEADEWYEDRFNDDQEFEDEDDDPVEDKDYSKIIADVAVVPGAFKPPHKGHLDMVRKYAEMANKVIVLISKPTLNGRRLPPGSDGKPGREINAEDSLQLWQMLASGLPDNEVEIKISPTHASPINAAYEYIGEEGPLSPGTRVILGASTKDNDWRRWMGAEKYVKAGVELLDPEATAVKPTMRIGTDELGLPLPYSATAFRDALADPINNRAEIAEFIGEENVDNILSILGLSASVEEMSVGAGSVAGAVGNSRKKRIVTRENIDLHTLDEVMRLIMERGILR